MSVIPDAARPPERTRLAWQRTALAGIGALLVVVRLLIEVAPALGVIVGVASVLVLLAPVWSAAHWQLSGRGTLTVPLTDGRAALVLALLLVVVCLTGLGYVLLA